MKKTISILVIGALPALALAGGGDTTGQHEHAKERHEHATEQHKDAKKQHGHGSDDGSGMGHDHNESVAGRPGDRANIGRTVEVTMEDTMRFTPNQLKFDTGETVRFVMQNHGKIPHEFVIGSMSELKEHAEMMRTMPTMQHAEPNMVTVAAGAQGEVVWKFDQPGTVDFACLIPGHLEAGMRGSIKVE